VVKSTNQDTEILLQLKRKEIALLEAKIENNKQILATMNHQPDNESIKYLTVNIPKNR
jgi:hypothetical protein